MTIKSLSWWKSIYSVNIQAGLCKLWEKSGCKCDVSKKHSWLKRNGVCAILLNHKTAEYRWLVTGHVPWNRNRALPSNNNLSFPKKKNIFFKWRVAWLYAWHFTLKIKILFFFLLLLNTIVFVNYFSHIQHTFCALKP